MVKGIYSEETIAWMYIIVAKHELDLMFKIQEEQSDKVFYIYSDIDTRQKRFSLNDKK